MLRNSDSRTMGSGDFIIGMICGVAVGAAVGLVLAPQSGADTRKQIAKSGEKLRDGVNRAYTQVNDGVSSILSRGRDAVDLGREAVERGREAYENVRAGNGSAT